MIIFLHFYSKIANKFSIYDNHNDNNNIDKKNYDDEDFDDDEDYVDIDQFSVKYNVEQLQLDDENDPDLFWYEKFGSMKKNPNSKDPKDYPDIRWAKKGSDADTNLTNIKGGRFQYQKKMEDGNCGLHFFQHGIGGMLSHKTVMAPK